MTASPMQGTAYLGAGVKQPGRLWGAHLVKRREPFTSGSNFTQNDTPCLWQKVLTYLARSRF